MNELSAYMEAFEVMGFYTGIGIYLLGILLMPYLTVYALMSYRRDDF